MLADWAIPCESHTGLCIITKKKLANAVVLHNSWDKDEEGNTLPDTYIVVICTPNIDDFTFEKKPSPVPITSLFEKRSVYFLQLKKDEFYGNFFPVCKYPNSFCF